MGRVWECEPCGHDYVPNREYRECPYCKIAQLEQEKAILKEDFAGLQGRIEQVVEDYEAEREGMVLVNAKHLDCVLRGGGWYESNAAKVTWEGWELCSVEIEKALKAHQGSQ